jgi:hypothetical protein
MMQVVAKTTTPIVIGRSKFAMLSIAILPRPGRP